VRVTHRHLHGLVAEELGNRSQWRPLASQATTRTCAACHRGLATPVPRL